ncbi:DNA-deoxyinosine glycosylase [Chitinibacter sp. S2-10]|uniref:DNA-deoxyinosine glycosylase n=1 Tax=Chitinibacter sp. S2-10 TaxID=3373597 RepID=UPI0039778F76
MSDSALFKQSFAPIANDGCRLLILGSLPGDISLQHGHYYAHPRNAFWPILSHILETDLTQLPFAERYPILLAHGIALWDVVQQATRKGSLDSALSDVETNPLQELIKQMPQLELVIFNGQTAAKHGKRLIPGYVNTGVAPSSSPAYTLHYEKKCLQWQALINAHVYPKSRLRK